MKGFMSAFVASALASIAATASAQTPTAAQLDSIITKAVADKHIVGLSVGVMQNGKVLLAKSYGVRDIASKTSGHAEDDVRDRIGDEAVHLLRAADARGRAQALAQRIRSRSTSRISRARKTSR